MPLSAPRHLASPSASGMWAPGRTWVRCAVAVACGAVAIFMQGSACATVVGGDAGPDDAGIQLLPCDAPEDCPADVPECAAGICKRPCAADDACVDARTYCNNGVGYCEPGCRDSTTCGEGTVCVQGACVESAGCGTKCDCAPGQVCRDSVCQDPAGACNGPDECGRGPTAETCTAYQCNGFTHLCFDPDPQPCTQASDCTGRPGCTDGCVCTGGGQCVPSVACTVDDEATTCGAGYFCTLNGSCDVLAACATQGDCAAQGLTCNVGTHQCERPQACDTGADCTTAPANYCNQGTGYCAIPLCNNGGITCTGDDVCAADGRCITQGTGDPCTADATCPTTQYCAFVGGTGACADGCRNNASCPAGQSCNGNHACVGGGTPGGYGDPCVNDQGQSDDSLCSAGLECGSATGTCAEACEDGCTPGTDCCLLSGAPACNDVLGLGIFFFCGE